LRFIDCFHGFTRGTNVGEKIKILQIYFSAISGEKTNFAASNIISMTIQTNFLLACGVTALAMLACTNDKPASGQSENLPPPNPDTLVGIRGTDNCGYSPRSKDTTDFFYQKYKVSIVRTPGTPEQVVSVSDQAGQDPFMLKLGDDYTFMGLSRDFVFFSQGTAPDIRQIIIYNIEERIPIFQETYCDSLFLSSNGKLWFWTPIDKSAVRELPACPDSAQWVKDGLDCGYAQRRMFDPVSNSLVAKSEYICFARQK